ncbi:MAG: OsmC family protein [Sphingobacteriia bacterium]
MNKTHQYSIGVQWTGNLGSGTSAYTAYERSHLIVGTNKQSILASSDPAFRGDPLCYNPEELLVASLSSCHMLWYLHLCAEAGVIVVDYKDQAEGMMEEDPTIGGKFTSVTLHPTIAITDLSMIDKANELHHKAHQLCYIANSVNFPVLCKPVFKVIPNS